MSYLITGVIGQVRPTNTNAWRIYELIPTAVLTHVKSITICNLDGSAHTYRIFATRTRGQTYDEYCGQFWDVALAANTTHTLSVDWLLGVGQTIGVRSSAANMITFTVFGWEEDQI